MKANTNSRGRGPCRTKLAAGLAAILATSVAGGAIAGAGVPALAYPSDPWLRDAPWRQPLRVFQPRQHTVDRPAHGKAAGRPPTIQIVTTCDDAGAGSLREALAGAADGDTIDLSALTCSTITLTSGELVSTADSLTLRGPGRDALAIDGNAQDRVLIHTGSLQILDLTIANGHSAFRAGCLYVRGNLVLTRSTVSGCRAGNELSNGVSGGGAVVIGNLELHASTLSGNTAATVAPQEFITAYGGGAYVYGNVLADDSVIADNTVSSFGGPASFARGGGMFVHGDINLVTSTVSGNIAHAEGLDYCFANGGGLAIMTPLFSGNKTAILTVTASVLRDNSAISGEVSGGGAIVGIFSGVSIRSSILAGNVTMSKGGYARGGAVSAGGNVTYNSYLTVDSSTLVGNLATAVSDTTWPVTAYGGALWSYGDTHVVNSTISGNSAIGNGTNGGGYGGGIYNSYYLSGSVFRIEASTVTLNEAGSQGGGIAARLIDGLQATSNIIAGNTAPEAADMSRTRFDGATTMLEVMGERNLIVSVGADVTLPADTLMDDPLLLPLANNGGWTQTHALAPGSPAIDAGSNAPGLTSDQRGEPFVRVAGNAPDIGAFELQPLPDRVFVNGFDPSTHP